MPRFFTWSTKVRDLHRPAHPATDIVKRTSEIYEIDEAEHEPASIFYRRMAMEYGTDIDLDAVIRDDR
jgi:hypothetical protein